MTVYDNHNTMITAVRNFMQENLLNDYQIKIERHTYANGKISYYVDMKILEKYRI